MAKKNRIFFGTAIKFSGIWPIGLVEPGIGVWLEGTVMLLQAERREGSGTAVCPRCHNEELYRGGYCIICGVFFGAEGEGPVPPKEGGRAARGSLRKHGEGRANAVPVHQDQ